MIDHLSPKYIKREEEAKPDKILDIETEIDHSVEIEKDKTLDLIIGDNHKIDIHKMDITIGEETTDTNIMVLEVTVEKEADIE